MTRRLGSLIVVALTLVVFAATGVAISAATPSAADPTVVPSQDAETAPTEGAFGTNISVNYKGFNDAEQGFYTASESLENRSGSLTETTKTIREQNEYTDEYHERSRDDLREMEKQLQKFRNNEKKAKGELMEADLSPAEQFLVLESIEQERNSTVTTMRSAVDQYEAAIRAQRAGARSTASAYFGGALFVGLIAGALLGGIVPLLEAKKTADKMKLSRNVSYRKRAGLIPIVFGLVVFIIGVGLLWYVGAGNLIQVIL